MDKNWKKLSALIKPKEKQIKIEPKTVKETVKIDDKVGKFLAIDCEMVGVGGGRRSVLARVSIVNYHGAVVLDEYVLPQEKITDYRTNISGITPNILRQKGIHFKIVQQRVADLIKNKIIIGHALKNDFAVLFLDHPGKLIRDTSKYGPLKNEKTKKSQSLKNLAKQHLQIDIQTGQHSSVEDAQSVMNIYKKFKNEWEKTLIGKEKILRPHSW
jgi:RNA exonuclease 4